MSCFADTYQIIRIISASKIKKLGYASVLVMTSKKSSFPRNFFIIPRDTSKKIARDCFAVDERNTNRVHSDFILVESVWRNL